MAPTTNASGQFDIAQQNDEFVTGAVKINFTDPTKLIYNEKRKGEIMVELIKEGKSESCLNLTSVGLSQDHEMANMCMRIDGLNTDERLNLLKPLYRAKKDFDKFVAYYEEQMRDLGIDNEKSQKTKLTEIPDGRTAEDEIFYLWLRGKMMNNATLNITDLAPFFFDIDEEVVGVEYVETKEKKTDLKEIIFNLAGKLDLTADEFLKQIKQISWGFNYFKSCIDSWITRSKNLEDGFAEMIRSEILDPTKVTLDETMLPEGIIKTVKNLTDACSNTSCHHLKKKESLSRTIRVSDKTVFLWIHVNRAQDKEGSIDGAADNKAASQIAVENPTMPIEKKVTILLWITVSLTIIVISGCIAFLRKRIMNNRGISSKTDTDTRAVSEDMKRMSKILSDETEC